MKCVAILFDFIYTGTMIKYIAFLTLFLFSFTSSLIAESFSFDPSKYKSFSMTSVIESTRDMGTLGRQVQEVESVVDVRVKRHRKGWEFMFTPQSVVMKQDGVVSANPMMEQVQKLAYSYIVDSDGTVLEVKGFDKVSSLLSQVPPQYRAQVQSLLNEDVLVQNQKLEWSSRVTDYVGKDFSYSDEWRESLPITLPNGVSLTYEKVTSFAPAKSKKLVALKQTFSGKSSNMGQAFSGYSGTQDVSAKKGATFNGELTRVLDPKSMKIVSESGERTMVMTINVPGLGDRDAKMIERRRFTYSY